MEGKDVKNLMEAYASVYAEIDEAASTEKPEEYLKKDLPTGTKVKVKETKPIDEGMGLSVGASKVLGNIFANPTTPANVGARNIQRNLTDPIGFAVKGAVRKAGDVLSAGSEKNKEMLQKRRPQTPLQRDVASRTQRNLNQDVDLFDLIKGHLMSEGYADSEEAAIAIMSSMSEEWRQSILDESRGEDLRAKHGPNPSETLAKKADAKAMSYNNRDRLATGQTGAEARGQYLGLSGRARSRAQGQTPTSSAVGPNGQSRRVRSRGGRRTGIGAGENRDRPTG